MIGPAGHVPDHNVGHRHDLAILGLLDEDGHAARDGLAVKLDALGASDELTVAVVTCESRDSGSETSRVSTSPAGSSEGGEPRTQLSVLWAAKGVDVALAVHHHAELGSAGRLHQRLAMIQDLR